MPLRCQNICSILVNVYIRACRGFWGPLRLPLKHLSTQRELLDGTRNRNVKRRREEEVPVKREKERRDPLGSRRGALYVPGRGSQVRISERQFNLQGVHPCRGAGEPRREATLICANYTLVRGEDGQKERHGRLYVRTVDDM